MTYKNSHRNEFNFKRVENTCMTTSRQYIRVITKLPKSEQSYKGNVKTHKYINRQNQPLYSQICLWDHPCCASSLKQQSVGRHVAPLGHIIPNNVSTVTYLFKYVEPTLRSNLNTEKPSSGKCRLKKNRGVREGQAVSGFTTNLKHLYFSGNEQIHKMTEQFPYVLRVELEDFENRTRYSEYQSFTVRNAESKHRLGPCLFVLDCPFLIVHSWLTLRFSPASI
jgi:hypothetical protein